MNELSPALNNQTRISHMFYIDKTACIEMSERAGTFSNVNMYKTLKSLNCCSEPETAIDRATKREKLKNLFDFLQFRRNMGFRFSSEKKFESWRDLQVEWD